MPENKYRKRSVDIRASQFHADLLPWPLGVFAVPDAKWEVLAGGMRRGQAERRFFVRTVNGPVPIEEGEFILTGAAGEHYPCKEVIFHQTYEAKALWMVRSAFVVVAGVAGGALGVWISATFQK